MKGFPFHISTVETLHPFYDFYLTFCLRRPLKYRMNQPLGATVRDILKGPFKHPSDSFPYLFCTSTREIEESLKIIVY